MMNEGKTPRVAARLSLGLSVAFLALLTGLHVLEPDFNSGHLISEYQLGDYGFLMSLAFCFLGSSALLLALSLGPRLRTPGGLAGWWGLLAIGVSFFVGGVFPPVHRPVVIGYLHGISGLVAIFGSPISFTLVERSLSEGRFRFTRHLRWTTLLTWVGLCFFVLSLFVVSFTGQFETPLPSWVSLANRFLVVTYCIWRIAAAWSASRSRQGERG